MSTNKTKEIIEGKLSALEGKQIRQLRRAALMLGVDFGYDVKCEHEIEYLYSVHIHSSWRLLKDSQIIFGQSALFSKMSGFRWCDDNNDETIDTFSFTSISEELNETFDANSIRVINIEANDLGDLKILMENGFCLEIFVDSIGDTESWRFFKNDDDSEHFVVFD